VLCYFIKVRLCVNSWRTNWSRSSRISSTQQVTRLRDISSNGWQQLLRTFLNDWKHPIFRFQKNRTSAKQRKLQTFAKINNFYNLIFSGHLSSCEGSIRGPPTPAHQPITSLGILLIDWTRSQWLPRHSYDGSLSLSLSLSPRCSAQFASLSGAVRWGCWCWGASPICSIARSSLFAAMLFCLRLQHCVDLCLGGLLLCLVAGLQQVDPAASAEMIELNWKPFIYGGMASIIAEFGRRRDAPPHLDMSCVYILFLLAAHVQCQSSWFMKMFHLQCASSWMPVRAFRCTFLSVRKLQMFSIHPSYKSGHFWNVILNSSAVIKLEVKVSFVQISDQFGRWKDWRILYCLRGKI